MRGTVTVSLQFACFDFFICSYTGSSSHLTVTLAQYSTWSPSWLPHLWHRWTIFAIPCGCKPSPFNMPVPRFCFVARKQMIILRRRISLTYLQSSGCSLVTKLCARSTDSHCILTDCMCSAVCLVISITKYHKRDSTHPAEIQDHVLVVPEVYCQMSEVTGFRKIADH